MKSAKPFCWGKWFNVGNLYQNIWLDLLLDVFETFEGMRNLRNVARWITRIQWTENITFTTGGSVDGWI